MYCNNNFIIILLSYPPEEGKVAFAENIVIEFLKLRTMKQQKDM